MTDAPAPNPYARALFATAAGTLILFGAHHAYGAVRYHTPWRMHGALLALGLLAPFTVASWVHRRRAGTASGAIAGWALFGLAVAIPVLTAGAFEGLYNHVLKDVLFYAGAPRELLLQLFPPPKYELPNDALFEVSGVLQVVPAVMTAAAAVRFALASRAGHHSRVAARSVVT